MYEIILKKKLYKPSIIQLQFFLIYRVKVLHKDTGIFTIQVIGLNDISVAEKYLNYDDLHVQLRNRLKNLKQLALFILNANQGLTQDSI
jgi:hypothetical protein